MKIIELAVKDIIPYERNPRKNDKAVDAVAESIRQFGFKVPCVVDSNHVLVTGHTRVKACKKLGIEKVPCVVADDLTEDQIKAFRLADNKVGEIADWDFDLLADEIADIEIDMDDFGFDTGDILFGDDTYDAREHNVDVLRLTDVDMDDTDGIWQFPKLKPTDHIPTELIPFHWAYPSTTKETEYRKGVHFFIYDWLFERFWNRPEAYIEKLAKFDCVLQPDFSMYIDMPLAQCLWNCYRNRLLAKKMQDYGITVIPTIEWQYPESYQFSFLGMPKHSVVAVSTVGVAKYPEAREIWLDGIEEAQRRLEPKHIVIYGSPIEEFRPKCEVSYVKSSHREDDAPYGKRRKQE